VTSSMPSGQSGKSAPRVVIDTNIWVSGFITPNGPPGRVLDAARRGDISPVASWELADEVTRVLARPKLAERYHITEDQVTELLMLLAPLLPKVDVQVDVTIRDQADVPVVAAAIAGRARFIVTGDDDLFDPPVQAWLAQRGVAVMTATELLEHLGG
jgi:uncharacterized protein